MKDAVYSGSHEYSDVSDEFLRLDVGGMHWPSLILN